jgi:predicted nucleic acid-binding protein
MNYLIDTNLLIRSVQKSHPSCRVARQALITLQRENHRLYVTDQIVAEFWNVCTRPIQVNGLGLSVSITDQYVDQLERFFTILPGSIQSFRIWRKLVVDHLVVGSKVHDTRLVAMMSLYSISHIITFNGSDFKRFPGIEAINPESFSK